MANYPKCPQCGAIGRIGAYHTPCGCVPRQPKPIDAVMTALKECREKRGLTLRDVEEITDGKISNAYLSQLENGKITNPSIAICCALAAAYAVSLDDIAKWVGNAVLKSVELCPTCGQVVR